MDSSEALEIIKILADGIDPTTGEVFDADSPYQHPAVIRALFTAAEALGSHAKRKQRERDLPSNAGKPWSVEEDSELVEFFKRGVSVSDLSSRYQRTHGSIVARLVKHGLIESDKLPYGNQP